VKGLPGYPVSRFPGMERRLPAGRSADFQSAHRATGQPGNLLIIAMIVIVTLIAETATACPVCYGDPNDPMVKGTNNGVWVLLGIIGFVQIGFVAMFWSFWRRARDQKRFRDQFHVIEGGPHS
jgi:hypothetical protein